MKKILIFIIFIIILNCKKKQESFLSNWISSNDSIQYFFSNPYDPDSNQKIKEEIISIILNTKSSLYMFCYGLDEKAIVHALKTIYDRGVSITIVGSPDQNYSLLEHSGIPYEIRQKSGIQHIKMIISDYQILFSGTGNFTKSGIFFNSNLFFKISIPKSIGKLIIKKFYYLEYDSPIIIYHPLYQIKILKSPENGKAIQSIINQAILRAQSHVSFYIFSFYDPTIMNSIVYKKNKLIISGIFNSQLWKKNNPFLIEWIRRNQYKNLFLYQDHFSFSYTDEYFQEHGGKFHHKTLIIDNRIYTGSYNFSISARDHNSEIFFEIYDPLQIGYIKKEYKKLYQYASLIPISPIYQKTPNDGYLNQQAFCQNSQGNNVYFQNRNAFFFMEMIQDASCSSRKIYSSGIISSPSDGFPYLTGISIKNFHTIKKIQVPPDDFYTTIFQNCNHPFCDPCSKNNCEFLSIIEYNPQGKWLSVSRNIQSSVFFIWNGKTIFKAKIKQTIHSNTTTSYLYEIYKNQSIVNPTITDAILFFPSHNTLYISCIYQKPQRKNLKTFLILQEWYHEKFLHISQNCYIIR